MKGFAQIILSNFKLSGFDMGHEGVFLCFELKYKFCTERQIIIGFEDA